MSRQVQKLFDTIAPNYDLLNSLLSLRIDHLWRKEAVGRLKEGRFRDVLDLCAGTLALTISLLKTNPQSHVTAVDFSQPMLDRGRRNLPKSLASRVAIRVGDVMALDFPPASYHAAMCAYGLRNVDSNEVVLRKVRAILRPGGRLVILEFFRPEGILSQLFNLTYAEFVIPILGKMVSRHPNAYQYLRDSVRNFYTPTAYRELLKESGFTNIVIKPQTGGVSHLITAEVPK